VPAVASAPRQLPDALQDVAFVDVQVSVDVVPAATVVGRAVNATVGAAEPLIETVAVAGVPKLAPAALDRLTGNVFAAAVWAVLNKVTVNVFGAVSPATHVRVPAPLP
jgi:hypothetical protein